MEWQVKEKKNRPKSMKNSETEINKNKSTEEALRQSEERYRTTLSSIEDGYFEVDLAGTMIFCNEANALMFGYTTSEMIGMNYRDYTDSDNAKKVFEIFNRVYRTGLAHKGFEWEVFDKNGSRVNVETSVSLILDSNHQKIGFRGILRDVTKQKRAEAALKESEEKYRSILESIQEGYYEIDLKGNHVFFNDAFCNILGVPRDELQGMSYKKIVDASHIQSTFDIFNQVYKTGGSTGDFSWELTRRDGSKRHVEFSISLRKDLTGNPIGFKGIARDVSERRRSEKALRESEAKYRTLFEAAQAAIFLINEDRFIDCNSYTYKMFGCTREQIIGKSPSDFSPPRQPDGLDSKEKAMEKNKAALQGEPQFFEWKHIRRNGVPFDAEINLNRIEINGEFFLLAIARDISDQKQAEEALKAMSLMDDLTGLYNRRGFLTLAGQELKIANRMKRGTFLLFTDLDDLKVINDTFGHLQGDQALIDTAHILKDTFRDPDILARIGGDEFVILAVEAASEAGPELLLERLQKNLDFFNEKTSRPYQLSLSMGVVSYDPDHPVSIDNLLIQADNHMYEEKQRKKKFKSTQLKMGFK